MSFGSPLRAEAVLADRSPHEPLDAMQATRETLGQHVMPDAPCAIGSVAALEAPVDRVTNISSCRELELGLMGRMSWIETCRSPCWIAALEMIEDQGGDLVNKVVKSRWLMTAELKKKSIRCRRRTERHPPSPAPRKPSCLVPAARRANFFLDFAGMASQSSVLNRTSFVRQIGHRKIRLARAAAGRSTRMLVLGGFVVAVSCRSALPSSLSASVRRWCSR